MRAKEILRAYERHNKKFVILRNEGSSSISMVAVQGEEDASFLSMTNGKCHISFVGFGFYLLSTKNCFDFLVHFQIH